MKYYEKKLNLELDKFESLLSISDKKDISRLFKLVYWFNLYLDGLLIIQEEYLPYRFSKIGLEKYVKTTKSSLISSLKIILLSLEHELYLDYRNILESILKYFYFLENPMKFVIYNDDNYLQFTKDLMVYFEKHPYFKTENSKILLWEIKWLYHTISWKIHDPAMMKIKTTNFLNDIDYDKEIVKSWLDIFEKVLKKLFLFSAIFNKNIFNNLSSESRDLIISLMKDKDFNVIIWG